MSSAREEAARNKLLAMIPDEDFALLSGHLEHVVLPKGMALASAGEPFGHVYFFTDGIGSVVAQSPEGSRAEAGIIGFDGLVPTSAVAQINYSPHQVNVQLEGEGFRVNYRDFCKCMDSSRAISKVMARAAEAFAIQLAYTALSNATHDVTERLARWLLMCHDRVQGDGIELTHEFLSLMLAVRRPSVTTALHTLEGNGFIRSERGSITIRDRAALEEYAHDAYGRPEAEYRRLMREPV